MYLIITDIITYICLPVYPYLSMSNSFCVKLNGSINPVFSPRIVTEELYKY